MDHLLRDLSFAVRSLTRRPLTTIAVLLTLSLAIGATTAIFSIAEGVLLDPLPYPKPERIVVVLGSNLAAGFPRFSVSAPDFEDFRDRNRVFEAIGAAATTSLHLTGGGSAERLFGVRMTAEFFEVLGRSPLIGRPILPSDDRPNVQKVVVLSHRLWQRRFGGSDDVLGRVVDLSGEPYEVIGVMPPESFPYPRDFFIPAAIDFDRAERGYRDMIVFGRLTEGVSVERAEDELAAIARRLETEHPETNASWGVTAEGWHDLIVEPVRPALLMLLGAVGLVLIIATLNSVNLMLARLAARQREVAIRLALGASRLQLVRTFLVESLLLTLLAGAFGALFAVQGTRLLLALYGDDLPRGANVGVDTTVLLFALAISIAVGAIVGLIPAWKASRPDLREALSEGGGHTAGRSSQRLRNALVFVEVALSLVLLVGAGLLLRSFGRLAAVAPGFLTESALTANLELPPWRYGERERRQVFYRELFERLGDLPGAGRFAVASLPPITDRGLVFSFNIEGRPPARPGEETLAWTVSTSPRYFEAMGIPLVDGRDFVAGDDEGGELVAIVNQTTARRHFGGENPVGRRLDIENHDADPEPVWRRIVGVVADVRAVGLDQPPEAFIYTPFLQAPEPRAALTLYTRADPAAMSQPLRETVAALDPALPLFELQTLEQLIESTVARPRFNAVLLGAFSVLALLLAAVGVYGVLAYGVTLRRREIGIRQALGADRPAVLKLILSEGMRPVLLGLVVGAAVAVAANRLLASLLFGVGTGDPLSWTAAVGLLALAGLAACWLPARQAVGIDPWTVLREE